MIPTVVFESKVCHVHYYGTSRKYAGGQRTYQIGNDWTFLEPLGWTVAKRNQSYTYMLPPPGPVPDLPGRDIPVTLTVPTEASLQAFADALHALGQPWKGMLGIWPAEYTPRVVEPGHFVEQYVIDASGGHPEKVWRDEYVHAAHFRVGRYSCLVYSWGTSWREAGDRDLSADAG